VPPVTSRQRKASENSNCENAIVSIRKAMPLTLVQK
jgi:hypothetical protein